MHEETMSLRWCSGCDENLLTRAIRRVIFRVIGQKLNIATGEVKT